MRDKFLAGADPVVVSLANDYSDAELKALVTDLGGHDQELLLKIFQSCDTEHYRPSVVFAYTIKGWGLPIAGDPLNHAALLTEEQIEAVRERVGLTADTEWGSIRLGKRGWATLRQSGPVDKQSSPCSPTETPSASNGIVAHTQGLLVDPRDLWACLDPTRRHRRHTYPARYRGTRRVDLHQPRRLDQQDWRLLSR